MKLKMQLFGSFCFDDGNAILNEETLHSDKLTRLLAYLIIYRSRIISHQELIEIFCENSSKNPQGALKNLILFLELLKAMHICWAMCMPRKDFIRH